MINFNELNTSIEELNVEECVEEIKDQFYDCINNIPYIKALVSLDRKEAKDIERDEEGKIYIDITNPHILTDMDYFRPAALHYKKYGKYTNLRPNPNPNSEFGKWIREERRRCLEGYIRESDGEWITGDYYFFLNYCPIQLAKKDKKGKTVRVIDFPNVWDGHYYKTHYLYQCREKGKHAMELASRGKGKAHPYSQKVLTPFGWKLWGDLQIGDYVYGDDGQPTRIIDIPYNEESDIYTVTLRDGRKVQCTDGHLFRVKNHKLKKEEVKSLKEIMVDYKCFRKVNTKNPKGIEYNYRIPKMSEGIYFNPSRVEYDPYTLGLLIGDGCFVVPQAKNYVLFTCDKHDWETYDAVIPYPLDKITSDQFTYAIRHSNEYLRKCGLWGLRSEFKFIPKEYIYNSKEIRLSLLRGLMDADGTVDKTSGIPYLSTISERLKDDVVLLCRSLGYNVSVSCHKSVFKGKEYLPHYRIRIITNDAIFCLQRKLRLLTDFKSGYSRSTRDYTAIINIEYSHKEMAKCITVDNKSHCYIVGDFVVTHNSYLGAALLAKRFVLGESFEVNKKVQCVATASEKKYIQGANQLLDMFQYYIDFVANNTEWPSRRITSSLQNLQWTMGYIDIDTNTRRGTQNSVIGITSKDDESKLRGSRGVLYLLEEAGSFPRLLNLYSVLRPSVEDGDNVWGLIFGYGTAGDSESDFSSMQELMYNPDGYNIYGVSNVYDKEGQGRAKFTYFFPGYLNRAECYDENGNSNVTKALLEILKDRYIVKYNSTDINAITKRIAEIPITPQEAILRTRGNIFPVTQLNERLNQIDNDPTFFNDVYVGDLVQNKEGKVEFKPSSDLPIRDFPTKDNKVSGAIEIYGMPQGVNGKIPRDRYIASLDNYENDVSNTMSLGSLFILDLWTDRIVAEYTGRPMFVDDLNEIARKFCIFYNCKLLYENNKKNTFAYFSKMNCLYMLEDTPEYLMQKQIIKSRGYGNTSKGVNASTPVKNHGFTLIRDWLLKPVTSIELIDGVEQEITVPNLHFIRNRALLKELILFNPDINVDRVMSLVQLMIFRESKMVLFGGDVKRDRNSIPADYAGNDEFFTVNFDNKFYKQ